MSSDSNRPRAVFLLILLALIWGTSFILIKKGLTVFSAPEVGAIRVIAASVFLLPFAIPALRQLEKHHYAKLIFSGMMGIFIPAFLFAAAQTRMESSITGILNSLTPICTLLVGAWFFNQKFKSASLLGIIIGLVGTVLLTISRSGGEIGGINLYALLIVAGCLCYGVNVNFLKFKLADLKALTITSVALMFLGPLAALFLFTSTPFLKTMEVSPNAWEALGYICVLGMMSTSIATILFNNLIKISTPLFASSSTYLIPIVAVIWGILDGEALVAGHFVGMAAIILGVYLANRKR